MIIVHSLNSISLNPSSLRSARRPASYAPLLAARRRQITSKLWSPSDLTTFAESPWVSWLERLAREEPSHPLVQQADPADPFLEMLGKKGDESEAAVLLALRGDADRKLVDLSSVRGSQEERAAATAEAIATAPDVIYQAPMLHDGFFGIADFLVRVPPTPNAASSSSSSSSPSATAPRYMVWDAKLARHPKPSQLLQLCCYAEMLEALQGSPVQRVGLVLGATPLVLRVSAYDALYRRTRARFLAAQNRFDALAMPELPERNAPSGRWSSLAASELLKRDDLRLVARLTRSQAGKLQAGGILTSSELAALDRSRDATAPSLPRIDGLAPAVLRRLARQASLQQQARAAPDRPPPFDVLRGACSPSGPGLGALPPPHPLDAFFDLEGYPFATLPAVATGSAMPDLLALSKDAAAAGGAAAADGSETTVGAAGGDGSNGGSDGSSSSSGSDGSADIASETGGGREYLWGISTRPGGEGGGEGDGAGDGAGDRAGSGAAGTYLSWWAHDATQERAAFAACVDWITARRAAAPGMHVYHYGAYEVSVLRRLAGRYGTREAEVDDILRSGVLVDLYETVRHSLLIGEPRYSIKNVEVRALRQSTRQSATRPLLSPLHPHASKPTLPRLDHHSSYAHAFRRSGCTAPR